MNKSEQTMERRRCNYLAGLAWMAGIFGVLLLAVSGYAQTVPAIEAKTVSTRKAASMTQITKAANPAAAEDQAIRPFRVNIPDEALADLRRRIAATRFPD